MWHCKITEVTKEGEFMWRFSKRERWYHALEFIRKWDSDPKLGSLFIMNLLCFWSPIDMVINNVSSGFKDTCLIDANSKSYKFPTSFFPVKSLYLSIYFYYLCFAFSWVEPCCEVTQWFWLTLVWMLQKCAFFRRVMECAWMFVGH